MGKRRASYQSTAAGISEENIARNFDVLMTLKRGVEVKVFCWSVFHDVVKRGKITSISLAFNGYLELNHELIELEDIYDITVYEC